MVSFAERPQQLQQDFDDEHNQDRTGDLPRLQ
jgi:hypothetical protein